MFSPKDSFYSYYRDQGTYSSGVMGQIRRLAHQLSPIQFPRIISARVVSVPGNNDSENDF